MTVIPELEFKVGEYTYAVRRLSVFEQMHVASDFRDGLMGLAMLKKEKPPELSGPAFAKAIEFLFTGGSQHIAPEVRERVMRTCLSSVQRQATSPGVGWAAVQNAAGTLMFDDISLPDLIAIVYQVFEHNRLLDFFSEGPSNLGGQTANPGQPSPTPKTG